MTESILDSAEQNITGVADWYSSPHSIPNNLPYTDYNILPNLDKYPQRQQFSSRSAVENDFQDFVDTCFPLFYLLSVSIA